MSIISRKDLELAGWDVSGPVAKKKAPGVVAVAPVVKPKIRIKARKVPNQTELAYRYRLIEEFPDADIQYEGITLNLSGGKYSADWAVFYAAGRLLLVECKGSYRLGSAGASARAFKEAVATYPAIIFRHATRDESGGWNVSHANI